MKVVLKDKQIQEDINRGFEKVGYTAAQMVEFKIYGSEATNKFISHTLPGPAIGLQLVYLRNETDDVFPTDAPFPCWIPERGGVRIKSITGLDSSKAYFIRMLIYA